jgi:hypothetical protein
MRALTYLRERFEEPGSKRSLAVVLFALSSAQNSPDAWMAALDVALVLLGTWSFLQPEQK